MNGRRSRVVRPETVLETQIAVRAYAPRMRELHERQHLGQPDLVLVFDTETRTDAAQPLLFGSYQIREATGKLRQEGLIHGDLRPDEMAILHRYITDHRSRTGGHLRLHSRRSFLRTVFLPIACRARARVVGFNLPFDLSRLAYDWYRARNGGFTLRLFESVDSAGKVWPDRFRPPVRIKALDSRRNFISFVAPAHLDENLRDNGRVWRGRFLDLRTLAYALTDESLSLERAAKEFGLAEGKAKTEHGQVTPEYIAYNRQDTELTWQLHQALMAEWDHHPIDLAPEQGYSPAAISKAYLEALGVTPPAVRSGGGLDRLGQAMSAYYGGRAECRIRGVPLPVRYLDYASMYPTVFALMHLWDWVIAERLTVADATVDARSLLGSLDREGLHDPAVWPRLAGVFCRIRPHGDLLPVRARYGADIAGVDVAGGTRPTGSLAWTIGLNRLEAKTDLWFTLGDLLVAKILGGTSPEILEAFRVGPSGRMAGIHPVRLRGSVPVDPVHDDPFRVAIEERARVKADERLPKVERDRLAQFLKTLANGGTYGIFAEVRQLDPVPGGEEVTVHGLTPLTARVATPEEPGAYCFPPLAATITGGARLLLALLEADVEAKGGAYVACDTDSLIVVASEAGGLLPCAGGPDRLPNGTEAVRALSWAEVDEVLVGLETLNPYAPGTVPTIVKREPENFALTDPTQPVELRVLAGSAKRYALYQVGSTGVILRKASNHGLGLYRSPFRKREEDEPTWTAKWPEWVDVVWRRMIAEAECLPTDATPAWFDLPAVSQLPVSSPAVLAPFATVNKGLPYERQVKPFGFLILGHLDPLEVLPDGLDHAAIPMAPFTDKPGELLELVWRNRRDGRPFAVTTRLGGEHGKARLQTVGDIVAAYRIHPETKSGDPRGGLGRRGSTGVLPRLRVRAVSHVHIGKESNRLDEVQDGLVTDPDEVYVEYHDERREWQAALPALRQLRDEHGWRSLAAAAGLSERALRYALNGGKMPHRVARAKLLSLRRTD